MADTVKVIDRSSAEFYVLSKVNGRTVDDSLTATRRASYGQGFLMTTKVVGRDIPAEPSRFLIVGRNDYAAPIQALSNKIYQVKGETSFTPVANGSYVVKGTLGPTYSAVWIEDASTGAVVGPKIEKEGSAELGFFEK
ncbi:MAG: hypothetical protein U1E87_05220 [Alphaproteobacteria bacterium]